MSIDEEVLYEVFMSRLSKHELEVIDAVWASRENLFEEALQEYKLEMLSGRKEEI